MSRCNPDKPCYPFNTQEICLFHSIYHLYLMDIASDIVMKVVEQIKVTKMFALQLDESTDVSGEAQMIVFVRY